MEISELGTVGLADNTINTRISHK